MSVEFNKPVCKKSYYLSRAAQPLLYSLIDVTIKRVQRLKDKGYVITLLVSQNDQDYFKEIDESGIYALLANNSTWFSNDLNEDEIKTLYHPSLCSQNNTINVYLPLNLEDNKITMKLNNKACALHDFMTIISDLAYIKKYTINIEVYHTGLYIYSSQTLHKWGIRSVNMYSVEDQVLDEDELEDIEKFWGELVQKSDAALSQRIKELEATRDRMQQLYSHILNEKKSNKDWESKIMELKKIIQNIIF
jgi:hypothetical protein